MFVRFPWFLDDGCLTTRRIVRPGVVSGVDELDQHRGEGLRGDSVILPFQRAVPGVGEGVHERMPCLVAPPPAAVPAVQRERRHRDGDRPLGGPRVACRVSHIMVPSQTCVCAAASHTADTR